MDKFGNIALAYSVSNDDDNNQIFPGVRYSERYSDDPPGTLSLEETTITGGTHSQDSPRWGDYSALSIDPADGCTTAMPAPVAIPTLAPPAMLLASVNSTAGPGTRKSAITTRT
jgi:hypothetical protein